VLCAPPQAEIGGGLDDPADGDRRLGGAGHLKRGEAEADAVDLKLA